MYDTPQPLQAFCLDLIRDSVTDALARPEELKDASSSNIVLSDLVSSHLTAGMAEPLLESLSDQGKLSDQVLLEVFKSASCSLENVKIPDASPLSIVGLRVLKGHKIKTLEVMKLTKATVNELIGCLNEWTLRELVALNVSNSSFMSSARFCVVVGLSKLQSLQYLDVSHSEFNHHALEILVEDLKNLQGINISATRVRDLSALRKCKGRLKRLSMYNLKPPLITQEKVPFMFGNIGHFASVLCDLSNLVMLDISEDRDNPLDSTGGPAHESLSSMILKPHLFPHLKYLDISGRDGIDIKTLKNFIAFKANLGEEYRLKFLGLMQTGLCNDDSFTQEGDPLCGDIVVTGSATEKQIMESLRVYRNRSMFVSKSMCYLYNYTINCEHPRVDMINLIVPAMRKHAKAITIQMAASACLYNLTKGKVGESIHPRCLSEIVDYTLVAMANFPSHQQLQKNTLLTLCSDRILQEVTFDRFRCTQLVMESLVNFSDNSMNRMAVAICSILAAKISTLETSAVGSRPLYMETLLHIVRSRLNLSHEPDIMLKFTLSALWNLTDESPATCAMFLEKGGIGLYLEVLKKFGDHSAVETKILGLLNNIAEVPSLRVGLLNDDFVASLLSLLRSESIDVSYFAAGIFAHLLSSDGPDSWVSRRTSRDHVIAELMTAVMSWKAPDIEMVAYRSFSPFLPLLACQESAIQMWAVWAINHVCSKNPNRYCEMLLEERTLLLFKNVIDCAKATNNLPLYEYCQQTIDVVKMEYPNLTEGFYF